ncbi:DNA helicase, partial [Coemansia furcata]
MFNQNSKKQTTLSFAPKQSAAAAVVRTTSKTKAASTVRSSPYERPAAVSSATSTKSSYFPSGYNAAAVQSHKSYNAPANSYGSIPTKSASATANNKYVKEKAARRVLSDITVRPSTSVKLSDRQREAFDMAINKGQNMFITGSAGTGKSVLLREVIQAFRNQLRMDANAVVTTASTGIAAFHIGGKTIHSFAGVGYGKGTKESLLTFVKKSRFAVERWMQAQVLIIDEISMLDAALFDAL